MRRHLWLVGALSLWVAAGALAQDEETSYGDLRNRVGGPRASIVNGVIDHQYPTVAAILYGPNPMTAVTWCTATLVGCQTLLTAGHCVEGIPPSLLHVFLPNAGMFAVSSIALHPTYEFPVRDIALLTLDEPVDGIAPSQLNATATPPAGSAGTIVGFGRSGGTTFDYGLKRRGTIETRACPGGTFYSGSICWRLTRPYGPPGTNSNTCNADSGGPLFVDFGDGEVVAGVTSGGTSPNCLANDLSYDTNVHLYLPWLQSAGGADLLEETCGALPQVGGPLAPVRSFEGALSGGSPEAVHVFDVPVGTTRLRVALNGTEENGSDFDLYVRGGTPPTTFAYDCRDIGANQYGFCEITAPAPGPWFLMARRFQGGGPYHATVTVFGRDCALPENDGLECDDGNACTENDVCDAGGCTGAPVLDGETCDDGNQCTELDACEAGICTGVAVIDGTSCDDGSGCTRPDLCQAGTCVGALPAESCKLPAVSGRSLLQLKDTTPNSGDRLVWKYVRGGATTPAELGDPTTSTPYALCVYDEVGGVPVRILEQNLPPGANWSPFSGGFRYRDRNVEKTGIFSLILKVGEAGATRIIAKGKAHPLGMPALGLQQDARVVVQLVNDTTCWQTDFATHLRNDARQFRAR